MQIANVGVVELAEIDLCPLRPVVPPDRVGIPLHQLEESLDDCLFECVAGRAAVGIRMEGARAAVEKIQDAGRKIFEAFVAQRPDRRPFDLGRSIEWYRSDMRLARIVCRRFLWQGLRVAKQQDIVGKNGIARRKIREPPCHPDLVALKNSRITLDCLHKRAGFTLLGSAALAKAAATQSLSELVDVLGWRREIVGRIEVGIQGQIGFDPLEPRDYTGERAHMLSETFHRSPRRYG